MHAAAAADALVFQAGVVAAYVGLLGAAADESLALDVAASVVCSGAAAAVSLAAAAPVPGYGDAAGEVAVGVEMPVLVVDQ